MDYPADSSNNRGVNSGVASMDAPIVVSTYRVRLARDGRLRLPTDWRPVFVTTESPVLLLVPQEGTHVTMVPEHRIKLEMKALKAWAKRPCSAGSPGQVSPADARLSVKAAQEIRLGSEGRFTIPRALIDLIGLTGEVMLVGCFDNAEIWPPAKWLVQLEALRLDSVNDRYAAL